MKILLTRDISPARGPPQRPDLLPRRYSQNLRRGAPLSLFEPEHSMGAVVFLSLLAAVPACAIAALLWLRVGRAGASADLGRRIARAAAWTALALALQAVSFCGTAYVALTG
jgi:hypothetical protein